MSSNPAHQLFFYFPTRKYLTILFKFLDFPWSLDRLNGLIRVIISEFYMALEKKFYLNINFSMEGRLAPCTNGVHDDIFYSIILFK